MYYGAIKGIDIANGVGVRVSLFVSGCTNHCEKCFQPETWSFTYGKPFDEEAERKVLDALSKPFIRGLSVLGGEPFEPENQRALLPFLRRVREAYPGKDIWAYSGFRLDDELFSESHARCEVTDQLLSLIDVLVDGRFVEKKKDPSLAFRGSSNQRVIDVPKSLARGEVVLWEED
ncbi:MAG: anaerobic ribonucleoside-triphosphate reductase activating protein [Clostridiales bacterium]|nr:anaerobic ribonucleoside-triphosphate reductase activating protein [Clostridiales bacterium]